MTTGDAWDRLQALFDEASALSGQGREAMLHSLAASDPDLEARLRRMLASSEQPSILDRDVGDVARSAWPEPALPESIGPYRVLRLLGEGGMGVVHLVERADVGGTAALKLLRDAWISPSRR